MILFDGTIGSFSWKDVPRTIQGYDPDWENEPNTTRTILSPAHNSTRDSSTIHSSIVTSALMLASDAACNSYRFGTGVVKTADDMFAAEYHHSNGQVSIAIYNRDSGIIRACRLDGRKAEAFPPLRKNAKANGLCLFMAIMAAEADVKADVKNNIELLDPASGSTARQRTDALFWLSDYFYFSLKDEKIPVHISLDGNIPTLSITSISNGSLSGQLLVGTAPTIQKDKAVSGGASPKKAAVKDIAYYKAMPEVVSYVQEHRGIIDAEAQKFIPSYPDDFPVPAEVGKMILRTVKSVDFKRPVVQFGWRGVSGFGKSTGVEIFCSILQKPLLRFTCSSGTETQDFLTQIVPDTRNQGVTGAAKVSFDDICFDPDGAWEKLTGQKREGVTCEEAFQEALKHTSSTNSTPRYVMQESSYIRALKNGWVCEVQEASRIRDPGVLPGLNEYDRPGALIPLVDGTYAKRHKDALVIMTDNTGYRSCNELDPAVIRRFAFFIDSKQLPKDVLIKRVKLNQKAALKMAQFSPDVVTMMYGVWEKVLAYAEDNDLLSAGGCVTSEEFERWVEMTCLDGLEAIQDTCRECLVNKATSDADEQEQIMASVVREPLNAILEGKGV